MSTGRHEWLKLKQAWRDSTPHIVFTPHELIEKLLPLIPCPRCPLVRYHGILGPAVKDRAWGRKGHVGLCSLRGILISDIFSAKAKGRFKYLCSGWPGPGVCDLNPPLQKAVQA